jgi:hypothetical protein
MIESDKIEVSELITEEKPEIIEITVAFQQ